MGRNWPRANDFRMYEGTFRIGPARELLGEWLGAFACIDCHLLLRGTDVVVILPEGYDVPASTGATFSATVGQMAAVHATCLLQQIQTALGLSIEEARATTAAIKEIVG